MDNGCPKCGNIKHKHCKLNMCVKTHDRITCRLPKTGEMCEYHIPSPKICIDCRLEQAEHDVLKAMNRVEELKKEKENGQETIRRNA